MSAPRFQVIRGDATPEDIAALLAVCAVAQERALPKEPTAIHAWNSRHRMMHAFPAAGPGAWRASGMAQ